MGQRVEIGGEKRASMQLNLKWMKLGAGNSELDQIFGKVMEK